MDVENRFLCLYNRHTAHVCHTGTHHISLWGHFPCSQGTAEAWALMELDWTRAVWERERERERERESQLCNSIHVCFIQSRSKWCLLCYNSHNQFFASNAFLWSHWTVTLFIANVLSFTLFCQIYFISNNYMYMMIHYYNQLIYLSMHVLYLDLFTLLRYRPHGLYVPSYEKGISLHGCGCTPYKEISCHHIGIPEYTSTHLCGCNHKYSGRYV